MMRKWTVNLNGVTSRIDGVIKAVYVEENQTIQVGQLVAEMDSRRLRSRLGTGASAVAEGSGRICELKIRTSLSRRVPRETNISTSQSEVANAEGPL